MTLQQPPSQSQQTSSCGFQSITQHTPSPMPSLNGKPNFGCIKKKMFVLHARIEFPCKLVVKTILMYNMLLQSVGQLINRTKDHKQIINENRRANAKIFPEFKQFQCERLTIHRFYFDISANKISTWIFIMNAFRNDLKIFFN